MTHNKESPMDTSKFNDKLNKIFNLKESVQPEVVGIVKPEEDSIEAFRGIVQTRLRGLKNQDPKPHTQVDKGAPGEAVMEQPKQIDTPYPDPKKVTQAVGVQKSQEEILV